MEWVETTGKTIEEAKEAALDQLGVDETEAEFEIVEEAKSGLFGRVRREARVRARIQPKKPRPKNDRRERRRRPAKGEGSGRNGNGGDAKASGGGTASGGAKNGGGGAGSSKGAKGRSGPKNGGAGRSGGARPSEATVTTDVPEDQARRASARSAAASHSPAPAERSDDNQDRAADRPADSSEERPPGSDTSAQGKQMSSETVTIDEQAAIIEDFLDGLIDAFGVDTDIRREEIDDELLEVQVEADDLGLLIGPKGQTLGAIQELARTVLQRKATGVYEGRVRIDIGGYRNRRRAALERFATSVAEQVVASGTQKVLEPMNPADRKVVHDTINEIDGVETTSEGTEPYRRVVIQPAP